MGLLVPRATCPPDQAQHYALLTYALDSVVFAQLKATGADLKGHPIMLELERVKALMDKIKRFEAGDLSDPWLKVTPHRQASCCAVH